MPGKKGNAVLVLSFLLPSLIGFVFFILFPAAASLWLSFTDFTGGKRGAAFIGLRNFQRLTQDELFLKSLVVTIEFVVLSVVLQLFFALLFALILHRKFLGRNLFRGLFFFPSILSSVAMSLAFMLLFHPLVGPVNQFLVSIGLPGQPWLTSPNTALGTIIFVTVWQSFGYYMVIFLSGLSGINPSLYESAALDGASATRRLFSITLPMLSPTTFFCVTMAVIKGFQVFDQIYVMTGGQEGGGPAGSTRVLVFHIYKNAFSFFRMGYASAQAMVLLALVLAITAFQYRRQRNWVSYDLV